jgi:hypothetical protein
LTLLTGLGEDREAVPRQSGIWVIVAAVTLLVLTAPAAASAETLRVVTDVPDGTAEPSDFTIHVLLGSEEVTSAPGSASGTEFVLNPGVYRLTRSGPEGYARTSSGDCNPGGVVELVEADATCMLVLDHVTVPEDGCLDYPTFTEPARLTPVGAAAVVDDALHLNPESGGLGAAWFGAAMPVANGFTTDFDFRITGGDAADGLAFVIQNDGPDALGDSGGGIGYQGLRNSLAVELDTFWNGDEPADNHVAVHSAGQDPNSAGRAALLGQPAVVDSIADGQTHHVRVVYVPGKLEVFVDDITTPTLVLDVDLSSLLALDAGTALVGFTAATGGFWEGHRIESWALCAEQQPPATLRVTTQVEGGAWLAEDFTVHVSSGGFDAFGSPQPGSSTTPTDFALDPGEYVVSAPARGYAATFSGDCEDGAIALAAGETKVCTITNRAVPLGPGLVVESYESSRTEGEWGLTESYLTETRAYLEDPANFGPNGTVGRTLRVAPGIRVANDRTLAGVDVFFTGWVPTESYTSPRRPRYATSCSAAAP